MNLKGQWVWVTGASSGLGLELSKQLAKLGANLLITARRADRLEALAVELRKGGVEVKVAPADMSRPADVDKVLGVAKALPLAAVVLNAGVTHFGHHHELEWSAFEAMLQTNVVEHHPDHHRAGEALPGHRRRGAHHAGDLADRAHPHAVPVRLLGHQGLPEHLRQWRWRTSSRAAR